MNGHSKKTTNENVLITAIQLIDKQANDREEDIVLRMEEIRRITKVILHEIREQAEAGKL